MSKIKLQDLKWYDEESYMEHEGFELPKFKEVSFLQNYLNIIIDALDSKEITINEENAFSYLQDNIVKIIDSAVDKLIKEATEESYHYPVLDHGSKEEILKEFEISEVKILRYHKDNFSYVGYWGDCSWDPEHGFGFMTYKGNIIEVGDWSTYSSGSLKIKVHQGLYKTLEEAEIASEKRIEEMRNELCLNPKKKSFWSFFRR